MAALVTIASVACAISASASSDLRFNRISLDQGLSQAAVQTILQDHHGFMWFGTQEGLNRYDGYEFKVFSVDSGQAGSISHDWIWSILEDREHRIWIGTDGGGLNLFNPSTETFQHFMSDAEDPNSLSHNRVRVVYEDRAGRLWVGTDGGGLDRFDPDEGTFIHYRSDASDPSSLTDNRVLALLEDRRGFLWIGTDGGGLNRLDPETGALERYRHVPDQTSSLASDRIRSLFEDSRGDLWIGTLESGLDRFDAGTESFEHFRHDSADLGSLGHDRIRDIFEDSEGILWVATDGGISLKLDDDDRFVRHGHDPLDPHSVSDDRILSFHEDRGGVVWVGTYEGLSKTNLASRAFGLYRHNPNTSSLSGKVVTAFSEDNDGRVWIGTYGAGLNRFDPKTGAFAHYRYSPGNETGLSDNRVMYVLADRKGIVWVGTRSSGLDRLDPVSGKVKRFRHDPRDETSLSDDGVTSILEDQRGDLWVGIYGGGLNRYDRATGGFTRFQRNVAELNTLSSDRVISIFEDRLGLLWIGTEGGGVNRLDPTTLEFEHFEHDPDNEASLSSNVAWSFYEDERRGLWIGTQDGGLNHWSPDDRDAGRSRFTRFTKSHGLRSNSIYGILGDSHSNLWLSTNRGLSKFNPTSKTFRHYDTTSGLQSNEFNFGAFLRADDGTMYFGGPSGFNAFDPMRIRDNPHVPPIVLTSFSKLNEDVSFDTPLSSLKQIELGHADYMVAFEFAALDFTAPEKNQYEYKLEGFDEEWVELGHARRATYTNLTPGNYRFRVKGSNSDGLWNDDGLEVEVGVIPPPWKTWWAYTLYALLAGALFLSYERFHRRRVEIEAKSKEAAEAASRAKSEFLAMVSHEIRTPMNGFLGLTELLLKSPMTKQQRRLADSAYRSGRGLLGIINDILDFSGVDAGKLTLDEIDFDPRRVVLDVHEVLAKDAESKGLSLSYEVEDSIPNALMGDPVRVRQILTNLVGNAVKFTEVGRVFLQVTQSRRESDRTCLHFRVSDTGIGIDEREQERIFEAFSQADGFAKRRYGGAGLGLGIAKRLAEAMGGEIGVESTPGEGSVFWFAATFKTKGVVANDPIEPTSKIVVDGSGRQALPASVLVAEDNLVNQQVIVGMLRNFGCEVELVENGRDAVDAFSRGSHDVVLMDCQMPEMDGFEATKAIRELEARRGPEDSWSIPVLAVTAHVMVGDEEQCLAVGMNDFLSKPFTEDGLREILERWLGAGRSRGASTSDSGAASARPATRAPQTAGATDRDKVVLNQKALENIRAVARGGQQDLLGRVIDHYLLNTPKLITAIEDSVQNNDVDGVFQAAHSLNTSSANLGATELSQLFRELEVKARGKHLDGASLLVVAIQEEFRLVEAALREERERVLV